MHSLPGGSEEDILTWGGFLISFAEQCQDLGKGCQVLGSTRGSLVIKAFGSTGETSASHLQRDANSKGITS